MKLPGHALAVLGLLVPLLGCASTPATGPGGDYLENTRWTVVRVDGVPVPPGVAETPYLVVDPSEGRARGSAGCNTFNGPYRASGSAVVFGPLATTRKACPALGDWERDLLEALVAVDGYRVESGRLTLTVGGEPRIVLAAPDPAGPSRRPATPRARAGARATGSA